MYVFDGDFSSFGAAQTLEPAEPTVGGQFGYALALDGNRLVIGAPGEDGVGAAYVFERAGTTDAQGRQWHSVQRLDAPAGTAMSFGKVVAARGNQLFVAAPKDRDGEGVL